ncbi:MAG: tetratricopeptide repeat protein [Candidatus Yanofskybacteria bacterium]|nr:tetratricopeptide repeat protein [Candidatus Yanofskybacteria bacterium]
MFIIVPLLLIVASAGSIIFIIWRKLPRLEELAKIELNSTVAESTNRASLESDWRRIFYDLCPEIWNWVKSIKVREYKEMWLIETEKLLRRLRLVSLKIDRFSDSLIKKIRKQTHPGNGLTFSIEEVKDDQGLKAEDDKIEFRKNEQRLIIEIAKNPKNAVLYEELGDLYSESGDYRDAKESYEAAIELNSNNENLKKKHSQMLEKLV